MYIIKSLFTNHMILVPIIAWAISQITKLVTYSVIEKRILWKTMVTEGGMPSAHTATVVSLATAVGWIEGYNSGIFALAIVLAVVIMRDALGVRRQSGRNATNIKILVEKINEEIKDEEKKIDLGRIKISSGHTLPEVVTGFFVGVAVAIVYALIVGIPLG